MSSQRRAGRPSSRAVLEQIVAWYARTVYGRTEGPGCVPFYCDPARVGHFAVDPVALARGTEAALFQLFVTMSLYQARRDVDIMALQRRMPKRAAFNLTRSRVIGRLVASERCELFASPESFASGCSVERDFECDRATCGYRPRTPCHVKDATLAIGRMGDMGKLATYAWLRLTSVGGFRGQLELLRRSEACPKQRAAAMVTFVSSFYRVGVKLASMFVSQLSTPELAPGLTPWAPDLDGSELIVVGANVSRIVDRLRWRGPKTYRARQTWLVKAARRIDLRAYRDDWPESSPRLVQQAVYTFGSRSNRVARGDECSRASEPCRECVPVVCPFSPHEGLAA